MKTKVKRRKKRKRREKVDDVSYLEHEISQTMKNLEKYIREINGEEYFDYSEFIKDEKEDEDILHRGWKGYVKLLERIGVMKLIDKALDICFSLKDERKSEDCEDEIGGEMDGVYSTWWITGKLDVKYLLERIKEIVREYKNK